MCIQDASFPQYRPTGALIGLGNITHWQKSSKLAFILSIFASKFKVFSNISFKFNLVIVQ